MVATSFAPIVAHYKRSPIIKVCSCGQEYTLEEWSALPYVGLFDIDEDDDQAAEMRNCPCGSSIAIELRQHR
jgi:hypothetical protein